MPFLQLLKQTFLAILLFFSPQSKNMPLPTFIPTATITPSPTLTPTPIPTSTPKPTSTPRPSPKPTAAPSGPFTLWLDMNHTKMITDTAADSDCSTNCPVLNLADYVSKNGGFAGVNGTYFCPATYPDCSSKTNSFDFPVYNSRLNHWINAYALGWNERRAIVYQDGSGVHYLNSSAGFGGGLSAGIINYPGLVDGGNVQIDDNQSGLSDKQKARNTKVSLCVVNPQRMALVVANNVTMKEFAEVNKGLGCSGALNLDTGGSLAVINNGRYVYGPGRGLPNAVIFANK